ncbi:hypothetical protein SK128_028136 [Halocaridina rubra]|uniref:RecQ-mediated genome instability protein 2 n=1 Tax=Halocaridina rubra TaxID=373956 RepID=A0AAN8WFR0_HALRR
MIRTKFDTPAIKLHIREVLQLENIDGSWVYEDHELMLVVDLIWIQGSVVWMNEDKSMVALEDTGCEIAILNCNSIPGGSSWITKNQYIMVVGEIHRNPSGENTVHAIKMVSLSNRTVCEELWPLEIMELREVYKEMYSASNGEVSDGKGFGE